MILPSVRELTTLDWRRVRDLRLASLIDSAQAFGGNYDEEKSLTESDWKAKFEKLRFIATSIGDTDVAIMSIENLDGDFGATCWIGGCWVDPRFRGQRLMSKMFEYVDGHALQNDWRVQGLGVWTDNVAAIGAYQALGFIKAGEAIASTRHPGKSYIRMIRKARIS